MRLTDCALIDQGLLAVEVRPNVPKWEIAPTPAHEEDMRRVYPYHARTVYHTRDGHWGHADDIEYRRSQ